MDAIEIIKKPKGMESSRTTGAVKESKWRAVNPKQTNTQK
jgi:hypothetical protein